MKTINDFYIEDGIAKLNGVSFVEEAKVVDEFLKANPNIKYASLKASDGRRFKLINERLQISKEDTFINPYYQDDTSLNSIYISDESIDLDAKVRILEEKLIRIDEFLESLGLLLDEFK